MDASWLDLDPDDYEDMAQYLAAIRNCQRNDDLKRDVAARHEAKQPVAVADLAA